MKRDFPKEIKTAIRKEDWSLARSLICEIPPYLEISINDEKLFPAVRDGLNHALEMWQSSSPDLPENPNSVFIALVSGVLFLDPEAGICPGPRFPELQLKMNPTPYSYTVTAVADKEVDLSARGVSIDGISPLPGHSVLLTGQTDPRKNRVYVWDDKLELRPLHIPLKNGMQFYSREGITHRHTTWILALMEDSITIGDTPLFFLRFSA